jgi:hypothetical protein
MRDGILDGMRVVLAVFTLALIACSSNDTPDPSSDVLPGDREPYAYQAAPPLKATPADGTYGREITIAEAGGRPVSCRRCAPYRTEAGTNRLVLDRGRFFVSYEPIDASKRCPGCKGIPGFEVRGHFEVAGDRIVFFNDANCIGTRGAYRWAMEGDTLRLDPIRDDCAFGGLRARFFGAYPWEFQS